jgi:Tfp pilus assembly protein PilO
MRFIFPLLLVLSAIGLFMLYTNVTYQGSKDLQTQVSSYNEALDRSQELRKVRDELLARRNTFATDDIQKLQRMLPDNVDNIRLIIEINNIASNHNLLLQNVELGELSDSRAARTAFSVGSSGDPIGSVDVSFSVATSYDNFLSFLSDLERSLRIVDVQKIEFSADSVGKATQYNLTIRTYWLH